MGRAGACRLRRLLLQRRALRQRDDAGRIERALDLRHCRRRTRGTGRLLDVAALHDRPLAPGDEITPEQLEEAERRQRVRVEAGDILLIRTGWIRLVTRDRDLSRFWAGEPGIGLRAVEWLHRRDVAAVAADNYAVEAVAPGVPASMVCHCVLIRDMGMTLGEIFDLDALAADCADDGVWEFLFTAPPLKVERAVGSPITPLAIK